MTMQLFSFGHPCEHQLRRTCIGGTSCPLNGYPDNWCCSFIKGKINFKRDKPCEGPRCRWGFTHPSQSQFDAVTHVLNESRPIAARIDDADDKELLAFNIENSHIVDTVQCALHMMRHPPSSCTTRVGQLLAYAALRAGDAKVFMQLLKTMKKPVDGYLLGAYDYLTNGNLPVAITTTSNTNTAPAQGKSFGKRNNSEKKEDASEELKNDMVDLMNAALSSGGQLVNREDQHTLQAVFIQALRSYPKSNKKRQEMLELAIAKFGSRPVPKNVTAVAAATAAAAAGQAAANNNNSNNNNISNNNGNTPRHGSTAAVATATATTPGKTVVAAATSGGNVVVVGGQPPRPIEASTEEEGTSHNHTNNYHNNNTNSNTSTVSTRRPQALGGAATPLATNTRNKDSTGGSSAKQQQQQQQQQQQPVIGISRLALQAKKAPARHYDPIRTDLPLPNIALFGGLFGLTPQAASWALLGRATCQKPTPSASNTPVATAAAVAAAVSSTAASAAASPPPPPGGLPVDLAGEADDKMFRFLASPTPGYSIFGGIDVLPSDQQVLKGICED
ncbi:hypothetical protein DQ04_01921100 [Trypanosoma grayi]|uniref:hypothetical protein n=1 Tax=Trypanosoma grayi TaxID=71804 RepID=UPI0004F4A16F|nr:hypothetical protein DQ04_01921100 [Trypanosoma grayi]KEG12187.1 hypothetical protein DQ04_01921100 [Trypanosoma grayi]